MMKRIGIVTIGQSPRTDVVRDIAPLLGTNVDILERGALDGLTLDQVKVFSPDNNMTSLVTRMNDGTEVVVAKEKILPKVEQAIEAFNKERVSLILLLCVGSFPAFQSSSLIVQPQRLVDRCVESLITEEHRLGIMIPISEQESWARSNFSHVTSRITVSVATPYGDRTSFYESAHLLEKANCDLIIMYCMGYTRALAGILRQVSGKPVILANALVARIMAELLE